MNNNMQNDLMLKLDNISKLYPGTIALHKVNININKGEVHGLIGKNGAGKSTLVGIIAGVTAPTEGKIIIEGKVYNSLSRIISRNNKIAIVPQEPQVILDATVAENLYMPDYIDKKSLINWRDLFNRADDVLKKANLRMDSRILARDLSMSERQLLLAVKASYVEEAKIIILDEASASLSQNDEKILYDIVNERKEKGRTIIFISHRTGELLEVCDKVTVLRNGSSIKTEYTSMLNEDKLSSYIIGDSNLSMLKKRETVSDHDKEKMLTVNDFTLHGAYRSVNFSLNKNEILGIAGLRGSGRTELLKGIAGVEPPDEGYITFNDGKRKKYLTPWQAYKDSILYLPEDREKEGLIGGFSVRMNLTLNTLYKILKWKFISKRKEHEHTNSLVKMLDIKTANYEQEVDQLSGGNKQKVVVGKVSAVEPKVLLLDEPTRGIDIAAKESILRLIKDKLIKKSSMIVTSPGIEDLIAICDRILVLHEGKITDEFLQKDFDEEALFLAIQGAKKSISN